MNQSGTIICPFSVMFKHKWQCRDIRIILNSDLGSRVRLPLHTVIIYMMKLYDTGAQTSCYQVSLVNHINTMHITKTEKCDNCGTEYQSREELIKHIVEIHTNRGVNIIQRHICKVCNVELHGDNNRDTHICRKPEWRCTWCKKEFYSSEARKNHICEHHRFQTVDEQFNARRRSNIECRNGLECWRASIGKCWFKHSQQVNIISQQGHQGRQDRGQRGQGQQEQGQQQQGQGRQEQRQQGQGRQEQGQVGLQGRQQVQPQVQPQVQQQQPQQQGQWEVQGGQGWMGRGQGEGNNRKKDLYCRFQEKCHNVQSCKFKHFEQVFLQLNQIPNQQ